MKSTSPEKLKIGLITGEFPPMEGGVGAFTQELARALSDIGHDIHIITTRLANQETNRQSIWDPYQPIQKPYGHLHARIGRWWWSANSRIVDIALRFGLDILNVQYQAAAYDMRVPAINLLPWRLRGIVPSVVTFHDLRVPYLFPKAGGLRKRVVLHMARSADGVIVTNGEDYSSLLSEDIDKNKVCQIPIGSNVEPHEVTESDINRVRTDLNLGKSDILLGYFGFLNPSKGADILIDSIIQLPPRFHLIFLGGRTGSSDLDINKEFLTKIEKLIEENQIENRVHWTGFLPDSELARYMRATDLMVMPYRDGLSLRRGTVMAILANGRPLLTTEPRQSLPGFDHGQNVWLTAVDDPDSLRQSIQQLADDVALRTKMGRRAATLALEFTWDKIAKRTTEFYCDVIGKQSA